MNWSNRGPGANGSSGVDVVADGAFSPGDLTLNAGVDGRTHGRRGAARAAPRRWPRLRPHSSTSPTAAHGGEIPANFYNNGEGLLKSRATDLGYDTFTQGAGSLDAGRAVKAATVGQEASVTPDAWRPVTIAARMAGVPALIAPGEQRHADVHRRRRQGRIRHLRPGAAPVDAEKIDFSSSDLADESTPYVQCPDYLIDLTNRVRRIPTPT